MGKPYSVWSKIGWLVRSNYKCHRRRTRDCSSIVHVLAGSAAYAVSEMFRWREGLDQRPSKAKAFYGVIAAATLGGIALTFTPLDPISALYWSAVINGLLAAPLRSWLPSAQIAASWAN